MPLPCDPSTAPRPRGTRRSGRWRARGAPTRVAGGGCGRPRRRGVQLLHPGHLRHDHHGGRAGDASGTTTSAPATVHAAATSSGRILENSAGMALYTLDTDHGGQSTCTGACVAAWPPLTVPAGTTPTAAAGVGGTLATAMQANGTEIVTYDGKLLYTFTSDSSPGQVTGNGVAGFSVATVAASDAAATTTTTAAGNGY